MFLIDIATLKWYYWHLLFHRIELQSYWVRWRAGLLIGIRVIGQTGTEPVEHRSWVILKQGISSEKLSRLYCCKCTGRDGEQL